MEEFNGPPSEVLLEEVVGDGHDGLVVVVVVVVVVAVVVVVGGGVRGEGTQLN